MVVVVVVGPGVDCCGGIESGANWTEALREVLPLPLPLPPGPETVVNVEYCIVGDLVSPSPLVVVAVVVAAGAPP